MDRPPPATPDEVAAGFPVPLMTLAPQNSVEEVAVGTVAGSSNGEAFERSASLSYTVWRKPADHADPANLLELTDEQRAGLDRVPVNPLPPWIIAVLARMRYPQLWDAVTTSWFAERDDVHTLEHELVQHVNYIVMNCFREERVRGDFPGEIDHPVTERDIQRDRPVVVDGAERAGLLVDTDPDVLGLGVDLGDRFLTGVFDRNHLPYVRLEFVTRPTTM
jgi:hypothetical protein